MVLTICAGGTILLENPCNSLIALHDRYVWMVKMLLEHGIPVSWLKKSPRLREYNENQIFLELKIVRGISNRIHFMIHLRCSKSPSG